MPNTRDPRTDPRPRDVLRGWGLTKQDISIVKLMGDGRVVLIAEGSLTRRYECLTFFRRMAATATVIKTAESEGK